MNMHERQKIILSVLVAVKWYDNEQSGFFTSILGFANDLQC